MQPFRCIGFPNSWIVSMVSSGLGLSVGCHPRAEMPLIFVRMQVQTGNLWLSVTLLKPRSAPALPQTLYDAVEGFAFRLSSMRRVVFGKLSNTWMNIQAIRARTLRSQNRIIDSINLLSCFQIVFSAVRPHFKQNLSKTALIIVKFDRNKEIFLRE